MRITNRTAARLTIVASGCLFLATSGCRSVSSWPGMAWLGDDDEDRYAYAGPDVSGVPRLPGPASMASPSPATESATPDYPGAVAGYESQQYPSTQTPGSPQVAQQGTYDTGQYPTGGAYQAQQPQAGAVATNPQQGFYGTEYPGGQYGGAQSGQGGGSYVPTQGAYTAGAGNPAGGIQTATVPQYGTQYDGGYQPQETYQAPPQNPAGSYQGYTPTQPQQQYQPTSPAGTPPYDGGGTYPSTGTGGGFGATGGAAQGASNFVGAGQDPGSTGAGYQRPATNWRPGGTSDFQGIESVPQGQSSGTGGGGPVMPATFDSQPGNVEPAGGYQPQGGAWPPETSHYGAGQTG